MVPRPSTAFSFAAARHGSPVSESLPRSWSPSASNRAALCPGRRCSHSRSPSALHTSTFISPYSRPSRSLAAPPPPNRWSRHAHGWPHSRPTCRFKFRNSRHLELGNLWQIPRLECTVRGSMRRRSRQTAIGGNIAATSPTTSSPGGCHERPSQDQECGGAFPCHSSRD